MASSDQTLLYDPLFAAKPDTVIRDTPGGGFFGKAIVKKTLFILVLLLFVGGAILLSFSSLSKERFEYAETQTGVMLSAYRAEKSDLVLPVDTAAGEAFSGRPVTSVRQFAVCGDETTVFILIGKDVAEIPNTAFYDCSALAAVLVAPENPRYCSVDGVLFRKENGQPTELMLYPRKNALYRARLSLGDAAPEDMRQAAAFAGTLLAWEQETGVWNAIKNGDDFSESPGKLSPAEATALAAALRYEIDPGIRRVGEMAFAECEGLYEIRLPETLTEIAQMAFFKCGNLMSLDLPSSVEILGPDAFSYCKKLPSIYIPAGVRSIGHHAFYGCSGADFVEMACAEALAPVSGQDWLPKQRRLFEHDVPVIYEARRGN